MRIQDMFDLGMKRSVPMLIDPLDCPDGAVFNLGCGANKIAGAINLDWPEWNAENNVIEMTAADRARYCGGRPPVHGMGDIMVTCPSNTVAWIHAYHFLEHLTNPINMLREMQRVLKPGGVISIVVPHYSSQLAHEDLDHKKFFALDTWRNTFNNPFYAKDHGGWKLRVHFNMLMAIKESNLSIFTQLVKEA